MSFKKNQIIVYIYLYIYILTEILSINDSSKSLLLSLMAIITSTDLNLLIPILLYLFILNFRYILFFFCFFFLTNEIIEFNNFFIFFNLTEKINLNFKLLNGLFFIHPILLYLSYLFILSGSIYLFKLSLNTVSSSNLTNNVISFNQFYSYSKNISGSLLILISVSIILGGWWAQQELDWGGWWNWDFVEIISLSIFFFYIKVNHNINFNMINLLITYFLKYLVIILFIVFVRYNIFPSIHNFLGVLDLESWFIIISFLSIFLTLISLFLLNWWSWLSKLNSHVLLNNYNKNKRLIKRVVFLKLNLFFNISYIIIILYIIIHVLFPISFRFDIYKDCYVIKFIWIFYIVTVILYLSKKNLSNYFLKSTIVVFIITPLFSLFQGFIHLLPRFKSLRYLHLLVFILIILGIFYSFESSIYKNLKPLTNNLYSLRSNPLINVSYVFEKFDSIIIYIDDLNNKDLISYQLLVRESFIDYETLNSFFELMDESTYLCLNSMFKFIANRSTLTSIFILNLSWILIINFIIIIIYLINIKLKKISNIALMSNYLLHY
jgi:cytochrome c biogenesis factor